MAFFNSAVGVLQTLVVALGAGLGIWGACSADQAGKGCGIRPASYIVGDILEKTIILTRIENRIGRAMS